VLGLDRLDALVVVGLVGLDLDGLDLDGLDLDGLDLDLDRVLGIVVGLGLGDFGVVGLGLDDFGVVGLGLDELDLLNDFDRVLGNGSLVLVVLLCLGFEKLNGLLVLGLLGFDLDVVRSI
jgi:hypothetical protein